MPEPYGREPYISAAIACTAALAIFLTIIALSHGITEVFPHLYYFPIILACYFYPRRGIYFTLALASIYLCLIFFFAGGDPRIISAGVTRFIVFVGIGYIIAYLSSRLRDQEAKFHGIFSHSQSGMFTVRMDTGEITEANDQVARMLNFTRAALIGKQLSAILPDLEKRDFILTEMGQNRNVPDLEVRFLTGDGRERWMMLTASSTPDQGMICSVVDITDRMETQWMYQAAMVQWMKTFNAVQDPIFLMDQDGKIVMANHATSRILGIPDAEIVGTECYKVVHKAGEFVQNCPYVRTKVSLKRESYTLPIGDRWFRVTVDPMVDEGGVLTGAVHILSDITDLKRTSEHLAESEARYRALFNSASDAIFIRDLSGRFLEVNNVACRSLGYSREELLRMSPAQIEPPEQAAFVQELMGELVAKGLILDLQEKGSTVLETVHIRKDGTRVPVEVSHRVIEYGHQPAILSIARDITDRKRMQAMQTHLAAIVESSNDAIIGKDSKSRVISWNAGAERMYGWTRDEMRGQHISLIVPEDRRDELTMILGRVSLGERVEHIETERIRKDGSRIQVSLSISPIRDENGTITGYSTIARDITAQREAEQALLAYITEAALRLRHPVEIVRDRLDETLQQLARGEISPEDLSLILQIQVKHADQIVENLNQLNRAIVEKRKEIPESYKRFLSR